MRGNDQQAYDRGTSMFSPDGRIYQVEYAREAVSRGAPSVGIRTDDGVVIAAQAQASSELMKSESIEKIHKLDDALAAGSAGHVADARKLIDHARELAQRERVRYGEPVGVETLTKYVTDHVQENTQRGGTRPYGAALLVAGIEDGRPRLFGADPSGTPHEWKATVIGAGSDDIRSFLESEYETALTVGDGVELALRALAVRDDELTADDVRAATVSVDDGFETVSADVIADTFAAVGDEDEE